MLIQELRSLVEELNLLPKKEGQLVRGILQYVQPNFIITIGDKHYMVGYGVNALALLRELGVTQGQINQAKEGEQVEVEIDQDKLSELPLM